MRRACCVDLGRSVVWGGRLGRPSLPRQLDVAPFFVENATSMGRVELWGSDVALRLPQLALRNSRVHYNIHETRFTRLGGGSYVDMLYDT